MENARKYRFFKQISQAAEFEVKMIINIFRVSRWSSSSAFAL
jgi:hypothetical protein